MKEELLEQDSSEKNIIHNDIEENEEESGSSADEANSGEEEQVTSAVNSTSIGAVLPVPVTFNTTENPIESTTEEVDNENKLTVEELTEMYNDFTSVSLLSLIKLYNLFPDLQDHLESLRCQSHCLTLPRPSYSPLSFRLS